MNRFSDEDFSDSDQLESEAEEDVLKKQTREMWKNLVKERGVLVAHIGASAEMTKEQGEHAKKALMEKAKDPNITYPDSWRPRFLRSGMVHRTGLYQLICQDYQTLKWVLQQEIPPLDGHKFSIFKRPYDWDCGPVRINTWLPPEPVDQQATLEAIEAENPGIGSSRWRLESISFEEGWRQLVADISCESALYLEKNGWTILFWACVLPVTRMSNVSKSLFVHQEDNALLAL